MFLKNNIEEKKAEAYLVLRVGRTKKVNKIINIIEFKNKGRNFNE
jgi:hypothetical protein